eukprot:3346550-Prymnesium_polylepis.2
MRSRFARVRSERVAAWGPCCCKKVVFSAPENPHHSILHAPMEHACCALRAGRRVRPISAFQEKSKSVDSCDPPQSTDSRAALTSGSPLGFHGPIPLAPSPPRQTARPTPTPTRGAPRRAPLQSARRHPTGRGPAAGEPAAASMMLREAESKR